MRTPPSRKPNVPITPTKAARICTLLQDGHTCTEISHVIGCSRSTVCKTGHKYKGKENYYARIEGRGRPRKMDDADVKFAVRKIRSHDCRTAVDVQRQYFDYLSERTVQRRLADEGLKGYKRWRVPLLTKAHVRKRRAWAEAHAEWGAEKWDTVLYSDESKFNFFGSDGVQWCRRGPGEALDVHNVLPRLKHGGGGVMVWGCMTRLGFGRLILVEGTMNAVQYCRILNEGLLGTLQDYDLSVNDVLFQQDNDPKHTAQLTKKWLADKNISVMDWPPNSPDQSIIENAWATLEHRLNSRPRRPTTTAALFAVLQEEWAALGKEYCDALYGSIPSRVRSLILAKGRHTRY